MRLCTTVTVLAVMLLLGTEASAQWEKVTGPPNTSIRKVVEHNGSIFALPWWQTEYAYLYRSTDRGHTWEIIKSGVLIGTIVDLLSARSGLYATTYYGMLKSTDTGETWDFVNADPSEPIPNLTESEGILYGCARNAVYRSTDGGKNWTNWQWPQLSPSSITSIAVVEDMLVFQRDRLIVYDPNIPNAPGEEVHGTGVLDMVRDGVTFYLATETGVERGVYPFHSWEPVGLQGMHVTDIALHGNRLSAITVDGKLYTAETGTLQWIQIPLQLSPGYADGLRTNDISLTEHDIYLCVEDAGLHRFDLSTDTWHEISNGINVGRVYDLLSHENIIFAACGRGGLFRSSDEGNTWDPIHGWFNDKDIRAIDIHNGILYAIGKNGALLESSDLGDSWKYRSNALQHQPDFDRGSTRERGLLVTDDGVFYIPNNAFIRSLDLGATWEEYHGGPAEIKYSNGYYYGAGAGYMTTYTKGRIWFGHDPDPPTGGCIWGNSYRCLDLYENTIVLSGHDLQAGIEYAFVSSDLGITWERYQMPVRPSLGDARVVKYVGIGWLMGWNHGLTLGTNNASVWSQFEDGLPHRPTMNEFEVVGDYIYGAEWYSGLWRIAKADVVSAERPASPSALTLSQNYPNPVSGSTTISYSLPSVEHVSLTVTNSLGQEVARVVDARMEAGTHSVPFSTAGLVPGVYFYTLRNGTATVTKSMLITR